MAVTAFSKGYKMTANGDQLNNTTVGYVGHKGPFRVRVSAIHFVVGATSGVTTIASDGASGPVIINFTPAAQDTTPFVFTEPQDIADLSITALGTNVVVIVFTE